MAYYTKSILFHKKSYALAVGISVVGLGFIFMMLQVVFSLVHDRKQAEFEEVFNIMIIFCIIIATSVAGMLSTVYKIIYLSRKSEIENLRYIGCSMATIKKMFFTETLLLGTGTCLAGGLLGGLLTGGFNLYYDDSIRMTGSSVLFYLAAADLMFCIIVHKQLISCLNNIFGRRRRKKKRIQEDKAGRQILLCAAVYAGYLILKNFSDSFNGIYQYVEPWILDEAVVTILILTVVKPMVFLLLTGVVRLAERKKAVNLVLALKHIIDDASKTLKMSGNLIFSIALLLFLLVMFHSVPQSTMRYMEEKTLYHDVYMSEHFMEIDMLYQYKEKVLASSLEINGRSQSGKEIHLKGIDENYKRAKEMELIEGKWQDISEKNTDVPTVLNGVISGLDALNNEWKMGDVVPVSYGERNLWIRVAGINNSYMFGEVYVDREALSECIVENQNAVNTWYTTKALPEQDAEKMGMTHQTREDVINESKNAILSGTEMIETILYIYMISSFCMLFNMFIISMDERKAINSVLADIGIGKERIYLIERLEIGLTVSAGVIGGFLLGYWAIGSLPEIMREMYGFQVTVFVPNSVYLIFIGLMILSIICIRGIAGRTAKGKHEELWMERG